MVRGARAPSLSALAGVASLALAACEARSNLADAGTTEPSPNASILPAPLATGRDSLPTIPTADAAPVDAGPDGEAPVTASAAREDTWLPADLADARDTRALSLRARFRWPDVAAPPRVPESNLDAIERARASFFFEVSIELGEAGRMCFVLDSPRFVLPEGTELCARSDFYGHALVWPDGSRYVVVQPGALRNVLNERRADAIPLARTTGTPRGTGRSFGFSSERELLSTQLGTLELEQASVPASGQGGALLCRLLVELAGAHPDAPSCAPELVPVRGEYVWNEGGRVVFEVVGLNRDAEIARAALRVPPANAEHRIGELPAAPAPLLVERAQLRALRLRPAPVPESKDAPKEGLLVVSGDDLPRFVLVDGVPVLRLVSRTSGVLLDLLRGTYSVATRTFLSDEVQPQAVVTVPSRLVVREPAKAEPVNR